jgi:hypothetical protein
MSIVHDKIHFVPKQLYTNSSNLSTIWNSRHLRAGGLVALKQISFITTKHPAHLEGGDGVTCRNVGKTSHPDADVCLRRFH